MVGQLEFNAETFSEERLTNFPQNENFLKLMQETSTMVIESKNQNEKIYCLTQLRRMFKFHSDLFKVTFSNILPHFITNLVLTDESEVVYNSLILVSEIFSIYEFDGINEWMRSLIESVLSLSSSNDGNIRDLSLIALNNASNNMFYEETLEALFESLNNKNEIIADVSLNTLRDFINFNDLNLIIHVYDWQKPFETLLNLKFANTKFSNYKFREIINSLLKKLGEEFPNFINNNLKEVYKPILFSFLEEKNN